MDPKGPRGKGRGPSRIRESWWRLGPGREGGVQSPSKTELTGGNEGNPEFPPRGKGRG